jgi:hypothetical protein
MSDPRATGQDGSAKSPASESGGTGGGGNAARDKSPVPTAEAPTPADLGMEPRSGKPAGRKGGGAGTGLHPGGTKPSNAPLAGQGQIGTGGGSSGPTGSARRRNDPTETQG